MNPPDGKVKCTKCNNPLLVHDAFCGVCGEANRVGAAGAQGWAPAGQLRDPQYIPGLKYYYVSEFTQIMQSREQYQGKWNWAAFFFGWLWAFTKGMATLGFVGLIAALILCAMSYGLLGIVVAVYFGWRGNYIYYKYLVKNDSSALF